MHKLEFSYFHICSIFIFNFACLCCFSYFCWSAPPTHRRCQATCSSSNQLPPASHVSINSSVQSHPMIKPSMHIQSHAPAAPPRASPSHIRPIPSVSPRNHPSLTSNGSGSSGVSSLGSSNGQAYPPPPISAPSPDRSDSAHGTSSTVSPTNSLDMMANLTIQVCQKG